MPVVGCSTQRKMTYTRNVTLSQVPTVCSAVNAGSATMRCHWGVRWNHAVPLRRDVQPCGAFLLKRKTVHESAWSCHFPRFPHATLMKNAKTGKHIFDAPNCCFVLFYEKTNNLTVHRCPKVHHGAMAGRCTWSSSNFPGSAWWSRGSSIHNRCSSNFPRFPHATLMKNAKNRKTHFKYKYVIVIAKNTNT